MTSRYFLTIFCVFSLGFLKAQPITSRLQTAYKQFEDDSQLRHATASLYVINAKTGEVVFDKNSQTGLAPASTQKIITAATAFELLGKDFRYKTELGYRGKINKDELDGSIYVMGSGDPTLGSWRWKQTSDSIVINKFIAEIKKLKVKSIKYPSITYKGEFPFQGIPDGWIWQDIGNYYGAGSYVLNWKENQFDLKLSSGDKIGGKVEAFQFDQPANYINELKAAAKGTGDNAYIYYNNSLAGTIPVGEKSFTISGAEFYPIGSLLAELDFALAGESIQVGDRYGGYKWENMPDSKYDASKAIYTWYSPTLDSIVYWFLQKSINLYGEALIKTFAHAKNGFASTDSGVRIIRDLWKQKGLDPEELNMYDGSGLSPLNRVTTHAQVEVLKYAKKQSWFPYYFAAFPEYNKMKMKSGTITDAKGFCGYQTSGDGNEYIFSFLVNNYSGSASALIQKMYKVLDNLK